MVALWQKIVFEDFAKVILGPQEHSNYQLGFNQGGYINFLDGRLDTEFATCAFRMGHTYVPNFLPFQDRYRRHGPVQKKLSNVSLDGFMFSLFSRASAPFKSYSIDTGFFRGSA